MKLLLTEGSSSKLSTLTLPKLKLLKSDRIFSPDKCLQVSLSLEGGARVATCSRLLMVEALGELVRMERLLRLSGLIALAASHSASDVDMVARDKFQRNTAHVVLE